MRSVSRTLAAPHETAPAYPVNASADAAPDPPPTAAAHPPPPAASPASRDPSHTSAIKVLRRPIESAHAATVGVSDRVSLDPGRDGSVSQGVGNEFGAHVIGDG